jgi:hypothetical protein
MPRVHTVKKALKAYPEAGIEKGDTYYWWQFMHQEGKRSKTYPSSRQLTQSAFMLELYDIEDAIAGMVDPDALDDVLERIEVLRDECQGSLDNMPEALQETSESGMLLQDRIDGLESWHDELDGVDRDIDDELEGGERDDRIEEILDWIQSISHSL